ncbi:MAG: hypothetical protein ABIZ50_04195, partial [Solirubrobacterales bacterium]
MVNFNKLADRAKQAREMVDQQVEKRGGSQGFKDKVEKMRDVAMSEGTVGDRAKAAAAVAREKPNPAAPNAADEAAGPIGGGSPPPAEPAAKPSPVPAKPASLDEAKPASLDEAKPASLDEAKPA